MWGALGAQHQPGKGRSPPDLSGWGQQCKKGQFNWSLFTFTWVTRGEKMLSGVSKRELAAAVMELEIFAWAHWDQLPSCWSPVAAGAGRATAYLKDPVREGLIAIMEWEMPSLSPPSSMPNSLPLSLFSLPQPLWVGGSLLYLIGVSLYRRRDALKGLRVWWCPLATVSQKGLQFFFLSFLARIYLLLTAWRRTRRKIRKGEEREGKKGKRRKGEIPLQVKSNEFTFCVPRFYLCVCVSEKKRVTERKKSVQYSFHTFWQKCGAK